MPNEKFQHGAFAAGHTQGRNGPTDGMRIQRGGRPACWIVQTGNGEIGVQNFVDHDIGGPGFGDIGRQLCKNGFQVRGVGGHRHVGRVGVGGPFVQRAHIQPIRADQPDAVDDDALCAGRSSDRGRWSAGRGVAVGEHHDHPGVARQRVKQLRSLSERVGMVGASAGGKRIHGVLELIHGGDELRIIRGIGGEAHHADAAA